MKEGKGGGEEEGCFTNGDGLHLIETFYTASRVIVQGYIFTCSPG